MANEEWKPVKDVEHTLVSNYGRVMNSKTGKILKPRPTHNGYLRVHLPSVNGQRKDVYIHRLVADAFCYHPKGYDVVNHIDFNNNNNHAENLEWTTQKCNVMHSMDNGRYPENLKAIHVIWEKDGVKQLFSSMYDAAKASGHSIKTIRRHCKSGVNTRDGSGWKKVG